MLTVNGLLTGTDYNATLIINGTGRVNATDINNIGEGIYSADFDGYWFNESIASDAQVVIDGIKRKFTGTGDFNIFVSTSTGTSPRVKDVISEYSIWPAYNQTTQSYDFVTVTLAESCTIPDGKDFLIGENVTLVIPDGKTFTVDGNLKSNYGNGASIIVESGGKIGLTQSGADLSEGTYKYTGSFWGKIAVVSDAASFTKAVADTGSNAITVTGNITVDGEVTLRSGVTLIVNTGATLTVNGLLTGAGNNIRLLINGTGRVNATGINNIGEGTYYYIGIGYWSKSISVDQAVLDEIKSKFTGTGNFSISFSRSTGTSPRVQDVISGYSIWPDYNQNTQSHDPVTVTLAGSYAIPDGKDLFIGDNVTLVIPDGKTLTVDGNLRSNIGYGASIIVESGGKVDLAQPNTDLSQGTYIYASGSWSKIAVVSDAASFTAAVTDTGINAITVNGNITVDGDVTLRNGVTVTVKSLYSLMITGQLKTSTVTGYDARLVIENGATFRAAGLTNLPADTYSGHGNYWCSNTWMSDIGNTWRTDLQNKFGLAQINGYGWSYKNPPVGVYLQNEISSYSLEGYNITLSVNYTIPGNAGLRLNNSILTIPDGVTLTAGNSGIQGFYLSKIILQGTGNIAGGTTLSGEGTYVYDNGQWVKENLIEVKDASELTAALTTTTPSGIVIHVKQSILDINSDIIIPSGKFLVIDTGVTVSTIKNINVANQSLYINGTLTISNGGNLVGATITIGKTGTLTKTETGSFATNTAVFVLPGGKLGIISPSGQFGQYFRWDGTAWVQY